MSEANGAQSGPLAEDFTARYAELAPAVHAWASLRIQPDLRRLISPADVSQEVWLRAYRRRDAFDPRLGSFRAWLFTVAKHVLLDLQRGLGHAREEYTPQGASTVLRALHDVPAEVTSITQRVARDDGVQHFLTRVAELDDDDRQVLVHCGLEELPQREAAARLGIGVEALAKRWQRLRARLSEWRCGRELVAG